VQFAAPIICSFGVGKFTAPNGVVDRVGSKVSVHQFLHGAWLLAKVLKLGHDDHQAASRTAKPTPMAMAVSTSRIFSFIVCFQVKGAVAPWVLDAFYCANQVAVHDQKQNVFGNVESLTAAVLCAASNQFLSI
jgi:hypothetical protein